MKGLTTLSSFPGTYRVTEDFSHIFVVQTLVCHLVLNVRVYRDPRPSIVFTPPMVHIRCYSPSLVVLDLWEGRGRLRLSSRGRSTPVRRFRGSHSLEG